MGTLVGRQGSNLLSCPTPASEDDAQAGRGRWRHGRGEPGPGTCEALHADPDARGCFPQRSQTAARKEPRKGTDQTVFCLAECFPKPCAKVSW